MKATESRGTGFWMFRGAMFNRFRDLWGSTSSPAIRVTPVLVNQQNHQRSSYPFLSYPQKSPVIGLDHPCFRRCDFQLDWMIMDYHGPLMDCHNSFMVHDGFLFHKWGHKLVQHIQDTPMVVTSPSGSRRQGSLQVSWHRHISIAQWPGRNRPNGMVVECHAIDGGIWTTVVDVGSLSSVGGLDHEVHPRSAQNRHPATWCTPFISPSLMCRQGQGVKDRLEDIGSKIGRWLECQTENMIGYWMILDDILEWYIGMIYWTWSDGGCMSSSDPKRIHRKSVETLVKSRRSARVFSWLWRYQPRMVTNLF